MEYRFGLLGLPNWFVLSAAVFLAACEKPRTSTAPDRPWAASADPCATGGLDADDCEADLRAAVSKNEDSSSDESAISDDDESRADDESAVGESEVDGPLRGESLSDVDIKNDNDDDDGQSDDDSANTGSESPDGVQPGTSPIENDNDDDDGQSDDDSANTGSESPDGVQPGTSPIENDNDDNDSQSRDDPANTDSDSSEGVQPGTSPNDDDDDNQSDDASVSTTEAFSDDVESAGSAPDDWSCSAEAYGDGVCDCGCGALDIDCSSASSLVCITSRGCSSMTVPDFHANFLCTAGDGWTCTPEYQTDDECDCGCGLVDPACEGNASSFCEYEFCLSGMEVHSTQNHLCVMNPLPEESVPADWTCGLEHYGDWYCDCGCGAPDLGCEGPSAKWCAGGPNCADSAVPDYDNNHLCTDADEWTCPVAYWNDGYCDCGCGVTDADCKAKSWLLCISDNCEDGTEADKTLNHLCIPSANTDPAPESDEPTPEGWTCLDKKYGDGKCTCGCGVTDIDCPTSSALDCQDNSGCWSGKIPKMNENHLCEEADWTCESNSYFDGYCDCGCGSLDYDGDCGSPIEMVCDNAHCPEGKVVHPNQNYLCVHEE